MGDEEYTENSTWPIRSDHRYSSHDLEPFILDNRWISTSPRPPYKKLRYDEQSFLTDLYGFHFEAYFYETVRRVVNGRLDFAHLEAPPWFGQSISASVCHRPECPSAVALLQNRPGDGFVSFRAIDDALLLCVDPHVQSSTQWIPKCEAYRVSQYARTFDARCGRFGWDYDATQYRHADTPRSFTTGRNRPYPLEQRQFSTTGGLASEFDHRTASMLEQENFHLLTTGIGDKTRSQYMTCWRRWAQFASCMDESPWFREFPPGWDNTLIDFLAWQHKILGFQHSVLAKGFYDTRYVHIAEGLCDITLRAHSVRCLIRAVKLRGETCKKVPFNTDLLRWLFKQLVSDTPNSDRLPAAQLWCGLLIAFFFALRVSELLALAVGDIELTKEDLYSVLSVLTRGSKTDQEKRGAPRARRENATNLCPAKAASDYLPLLMSSGRQTLLLPFDAPQAYSEHEMGGGCT